MNKKNLANAQLLSSITTSDTTIAVKTAQGNNLPEAPFFATLSPLGELSTIDNSEIVEVTGVSGDNLAVVRAQRGTTAKEFQEDAILVNSIYVEDIYETQPKNLLASAKYPMYISHRNSPRLYPEESMEGQRIVAEQGFPIEIDVMALSDGTLVGCHDSTVNRTMEGIGTGNVSSKTAAQWERALVKPAITGGKTGTPIFFDKWLDEFGGRYILVPELKQAASPHAQKFIDSIKSRNLEESVVVQSFDFDVAAEFAAQGLHAVYLFTSTPAKTPAEIADAGIEFASGNKSMSSATIGSLKAAGLKVIMYTTNTIAEANNAFAAGCDAVFSDDPQYVSGRIARRSSDPYAEGYGWPGMAGMLSGSGMDSETHDRFWLERGALAISATSPSAASVTQDWAGKIKRPFRISFDVEVEPDISMDTPNYSSALVLWNNSTDEDDPYYDTTRVGQEGFVFALRGNGRLQCWEYVNGDSASSIGMTPVLDDSAVVDMSGGSSKLSLVIEATDTKITMYSPSHGMKGVWSNSFNPAPMRMALRTSTYGVARFSNVSVLQGSEMKGDLLDDVEENLLDTGWKNLSLAGGYTQLAGDSHPPQYRVRGGILYFRGSITPSSGNMPTSGQVQITESDEELARFTESPYSGVTLMGPTGGTLARAYLRGDGAIIYGGSSSYGSGAMSYVSLRGLSGVYVL